MATADLVDENGQVIGRFPARQVDLRILRRGSVHIPQQAAFFRGELWRQVARSIPAFTLPWITICGTAGRVSELRYIPRPWANFRLHGQGKSVVSDDAAGPRCCACTTVTAAAPFRCCA